MPIKIKYPNIDVSAMKAATQRVRSSFTVPSSIRGKLKAFRGTATGARVTESWAHTKQAAYDAYIKNPACYRGGGGSIHTRGKPGTPSYYRSIHPQRITYQRQSLIVGGVTLATAVVLFMMIKFRFNDTHRQKEYDEFLANLSAIPVPRGQARGVHESFYKDS
ncbi:hypothetical protein FOZ63_028166 [Perkinsus olseni]|uniref:Uncharacterized protein n=1 Tax=Perkinsus olseni TaxID=32597 RepID=A0A7J6NQM5_PEROL|nr:hypothetical protein FOZ60_006614 [Perkinsus olseni]KAF4734543.1 hypothetical protein FOZ63_028166 [Perkinsus olseni]